MTSQVRELESQHIVQTYRRTPIVLVRGKGVRVYDDEGREYLDLLAGIGVGALGHGHEALARAIAEQSREMIHTSNLFFHPLQGQVAARLAALSGLQRAFFCNSGAEAVEACLKFARRFWHTRGVQDRTEIIAMEGDFHGRTMGALSTTWDEHYRTPFMPLVPNVRFVPVNNPAALRSAVTERTAAIILEPIQGEGGVRPLTQAFADAVNDVTAGTGTLLIADEVQCGLGRTGQPFYFQKLGLRPDLVPVGKALAGGVPMGAALVKEEVAAAIAFGDHGTTFGGNLLACRAALVCLDHLTDAMMDHVKKTGAFLEARLREMQKKHTAIVDVRGAGLMWGLELNIDAGPVHEAAIRHGVLVNRTAGKVIRLLPPLVITEAELDRALGLLDAAFSEGTGRCHDMSKTASSTSRRRTAPVLRAAVRGDVEKDPRFDSAQSAGRSSSAASAERTDIAHRPFRRLRRRPGRYRGLWGAGAAELVGRRNPLARRQRRAPPRRSGPAHRRRAACASQAAGFDDLCVFAHEPAYFAHMGFSIVPHTWLPERSWPTAGRVRCSGSANNSRW